MLALHLLLLLTVQAKPQRLLRETPMVMAHDAATGYLNSSAVTKEVFDWTVTQVGTFRDILDCGARALDLRAEVRHDGVVVMHHGSVRVNHLLRSALQEVQQWATGHPGEVAAVVVANCDGASRNGTTCKEAVTAVMEGLRVPVVECCDVATLTVEEAQQLGGVVAVFGCSAQNYNPRIGCYPPYEAPSQHHFAAGDGQRACYGADTDREAAFGALWRYANTTTAAPLPTTFSQLQLLWQETPTTIATGTRYGSSLVKDETRSQINARVLQNLRQGWWPNINFLELNNVCDQGEAIRKELLERAARR